MSDRPEHDLESDRKSPYTINGWWLKFRQFLLVAPD
jgi:hypothetical protein